MKEVTKYIENYIGTYLSSLKIKAALKVDFSDETYTAHIEGENLNFIIGRGGESLDGLQHLIALAVHTKFGEWKTIVVDINDYREKKKERIEEMTKGFIDRVRFFKKEVFLPIMAPFERKQVHEFVSGYDDIESSSEGEDPNRFVVLKPKI